MGELNISALGDELGDPTVTLSRYGHIDPSPIVTDPRSGGRWDGCRQQRSTPTAEQQRRVGD